MKRTDSSRPSARKARKPQKASYACGQCQKRRSKCTGPPAPCERCGLEETACAFDPGKDLRTRESRKHDQVYRALLDAFSLAVQNNDTAVSRTLFGVMLRADPTGKLTKIAQAKADILLARNSRTEVSHYIATEDRCISWEWLVSKDIIAQKAGRILPGFACDPNHTEPTDFLSKSIISFRDAARAEIHAGRMSVEDVVDSRVPDLHTYFNPGQPYRPFSPWSWACQLALAFGDFPFSLKMCTIYVAGIQMRYFINPCAKTFNDLSEMLRPIMKQYLKPHAAGADICAMPKFKSIMLDEWDEYNALIKAGHSCNWPYSDEAIITYREGSESAPTMSRAFIEHLGEINNFSIGPKILLTRPEMKVYVRSEL